MRLIDANARIEDLQAELKAGYMGNERAEYLEKLIEDYKDQPTVEARPLARGYWKRFKNCQVCSVCEHGQDRVDTSMHFCPNCGAKLDGVNEFFDKAIAES